MYVEILKRIKNGTWNNQDVWWLAKEKAALLGGEKGVPVNPKFIDALKAVQVDTGDFGKLPVYDLVMKRYAQMQAGVDVFDPFEGPVKDNTGVLRIKEGERASKEDLLSMMYYVENVKGSIPK